MMLDMAVLDFWTCAGELQQNGILCDVQFIVSAGLDEPLNTVNLHKMVLACSSTYFLSSLKSSGGLLDVYNFDGISRDNLLLVVDYMYRRISWKQVADNPEALAAFHTLQIVQHDAASGVNTNELVETGQLQSHLMNPAMETSEIQNAHGNLNEGDIEDPAIITPDADLQNIDGAPDAGLQDLDSAPDAGLQDLDSAPDAGLQDLDSAPDAGLQDLDSAPDAGLQDLDSAPDAGLQDLDSAPDAGLQDLDSAPDAGLQDLDSAPDAGLQDLDSAPDAGLQDLDSAPDAGLQDLDSAPDAGLQDLDSAPDAGLQDLDSAADAGLQDIVDDIPSINTTDLPRKNCAIQMTSRMNKNDSAGRDSTDRNSPCVDGSLEHSPQLGHVVPRRETEGSASGEDNKRLTMNDIQAELACKSMKMQDTEVRTQKRVQISKNAATGRFGRPGESIVSSSIIQEPAVRRSSRTPKPSRLLLEMDRTNETAKSNIHSRRSGIPFSDKPMSVHVDQQTTQVREMYVQSRSRVAVPRNSHPATRLHSSPASSGTSEGPVKQKRYKVDVKKENLNTIVTVIPEDSDSEEEVEEEEKGDQCEPAQLGGNDSDAASTSHHHASIKPYTVQQSDAMTNPSMVPVTCVQADSAVICPATSGLHQRTLSLNTCNTVACLDEGQSDGAAEPTHSSIIADGMKSGVTSDSYDTQVTGNSSPVTVKQESAAASSGGITSNLTLEIHDAVETRLEPKTMRVVYKCCRCYKTCLTQGAVISHQRRVHNMLHTFTCQLCQQVFSSPAQLSRHQKKVHNEHPFQCQECGQMFKSQFGIKIHFQRQHKKVEPKLACGKCDKKFHLRQELKIHLATHSDARPFACPQCSRSFKTKAVRRRHENTVHSTERKFMCDICGSLFKTKNDLRCHRVRHKDGGNPVVFDQILKKDGTSPAAISTALDKDGTSQYVVSEEQHKDTGSADVDSRVIHQNNPSHTVSTQLCRYPDNQHYQCRFCHKTFKKRSLQRTHENFQHRQKSSGTSFFCTLCNRSFAIRHYLMQHIRNRHMPRRQSCPHCTAKFVYKYELRKHLATPGRCLGKTTTLKPFTCPKCSKGFSLKGNLMKHLTVYGRCKGRVDEAGDMLVLIQQEVEGSMSTTLTAQQPADENANQSSAYIIISEEEAEAKTENASFTLAPDNQLVSVPLTDVSLIDSTAPVKGQNSALLGSHMVLQEVDGTLTEISEFQVTALGLHDENRSSDTLHLVDGVQYIAIEGQEGVQYVTLDDATAHNDIRSQSDGIGQSAFEQIHQVGEAVPPLSLDLHTVIPNNPPPVTLPQQEGVSDMNTTEHHRTTQAVTVNADQTISS